MSRRREEHSTLLRRKKSRVQCSTAHVYAALALVSAYLTYIGVGLWCTNMPPPRQTVDGLCFEVVRRAHYTEVVFTSGKPMREYRLLLRFGGDDEVGNEAGVHLYSDDAQWSDTIECGEQWCSDVMMMSDRERRVRVVDQFRLSMRSDIPSAESVLGLDGTYILNADGGYQLGSHRLCPLPSLTCEGMAAAYDRLDVTWRDGKMQTTSAAMANVMANGLWSKTPASRARCAGVIDMFPFELMAPSALLSISIERMLERTSFDQLYEVYEGGRSTDCIEIPFNAAARTMIDNACHLNLFCRSTASVSFTHVATSELLIVNGEHHDPHHNRTGCIGARLDASLEEITYVASYAHTMSLAWTRLFLMLFAAAIVYVRSSDVNVKVDTIFVRCIRTINEGTDVSGQMITMERAALALIAATTRLLVPLLRWRVLAADGLHRVLTTELIAGSASVLHWVLLHIDCSARRFKIFVFEAVPLFLGGSSAVVDVSCTTMLAFTNAPLRGGTSTFDAVVRMLTTVLIALVSTSRCLFSISCAGLVVGVHKRWPVGDLVLMIIASVFWLLQTVSIAVCICDLYATPAAWSFARSSHIDVPVVSVAIFSVFSVLSGPTIATTATRICERTVVPSARPSTTRA